MHMSPRKSLAIAIATLSTAGVSTSAMAQEGFLLEEVIVTAQKREQSLQDVPVSVNVIAGDDIAKSGIGNFEELSSQVPNLSINEGPMGMKIFIRGLGSGANQGFEQSVGLFIDGVYAGRDRQFQAAFMDVGAVEVLRGPQGTLFGKNTIAGAMTVTSAKPSDEFEASLKTTFEPRYESYSTEGVVSGAIADNLMGRLAFTHSESGGYMENTALDTTEPVSRTTAARGTLLWQPTDELEVLAKYENGHSRTSGSNYKVDAPGSWADLLGAGDSQYQANDASKRSTSTPESKDTNSESVTLNVNYSLGEYELTSITGYSEYQYEDILDADQTSYEVLNASLNQDFHQWSQEIRLTSPLGSDVDFITGLFYQSTDLHHIKRGNLNISDYSATDPILAFVPASQSDTEFDQQSETYAVFGSLTWHVNDVLHLTGGLRYTVEEKQANRDLSFNDYESATPLADVYSPSAAPISGLGLNEYDIAVLGLHQVSMYEHQVEGERRAEDVSPAVKVQYDLFEDVMLYASISKAFKSGGFSEAGLQGDDPGEYATSPTAFDFDEEEALSFEIGGKTTLLDGAAKLNFALYRTEYSDLQVSSFQGDVFVVGNAAEAISQGLEMDGTVRLSESLFVNASLAYLDATYGEYKNASCTAAQLSASVGGCSQDLSGQALTNAPEWSANISMDHMMPIGDKLELRSHLNLVYTDEQYTATDLDANSLEEAHTTLNARLAIGDQSGNWELALVGKNLTNEEIRSWTNDLFYLEDALFSYVEPPRTLALQFNVNY